MNWPSPPINSQTTTTINRRHRRAAVARHRVQVPVASHPLCSPRRTHWTRWRVQTRTANQRRRPMGRATMELCWQATHRNHCKFFRECEMRFWQIWTNRTGPRLSFWFYSFSTPPLPRFCFCFVVLFFSRLSPISYRPGLSVLSEDTAPSTPPQLPPGPPNRPLPPTPDDDAQGDRTLIMKKVIYSGSKTVIVLGFISVRAHFLPLFY